MLLQTLDNWRILDADHCIAVYADPKGMNLSIRARVLPLFFAPLLVLNWDEYKNPEAIEAALDHTLAYRATALHRYIMEQSLEGRKKILTRMFGSIAKEGSIIEHNDRTRALTALYNNNQISAEEKLDRLRQEWRKVIEVQLPKIQNLKQPAITPEFIENRKELEATLDKLPLDESVALKALGVEFWISKTPRAITCKNSDFSSYSSTRTVVLADTATKNFHAVWEELYHILIDAILSGNRPSMEKVRQWIDQHHALLEKMENVRNKAVGKSNYYDKIRDNQITLSLIDELMMDCYRIARTEAAAKNVSMRDKALGDAMEQKFGWIWNLVEHVRMEAISYACVHSAKSHGGQEADRLFENLEQVHRAGSLDILSKGKN